MGQNSNMQIVVNEKIEVTARQGNPCPSCGGEEYVTMTKWADDRTWFTGIRWCGCGKVYVMNWEDDKDTTYDEIADLG